MKATSLPFERWEKIPLFIAVHCYDPKENQEWIYVLMKDWIPMEIFFWFQQDLWKIYTKVENIFLQFSWKIWWWIHFPQILWNSVFHWKWILFSMNFVEFLFRGKLCIPSIHIYCTIVDLFSMEFMELNFIFHEVYRKRYSTEFDLPAA